MISCEECQGSFPEALYNELAPEQRLRLERHLTACPQCFRDFAGLQETVQLLQRPKRVEPDEAFWSGVWDRFVKGLDAPPASPAAQGSRLRLLTPRWAFRLAAALALIVGGFWLGRYFGENEPTDAAKTIIPSAPQTLDDRVDRYLQRSKLLLLGLANLDPNHEDVSSFDFTPERTLCRELIEETYWLKTALSEGRQQQMLELLSDLEVILLQISSLNHSNRSLGIELAQTGIRSKALLFRITLEEIERTAEKPSGSGGRSKTMRRTRNLG